MSFDSLRSLLRSCLQQSISLWSVVVNSAEFGINELSSKTPTKLRLFLSKGGCDRPHQLSRLRARVEEAFVPGEADIAAVFGEPGQLDAGHAIA